MDFLSSPVNIFCHFTTREKEPDLVSIYSDEPFSEEGDEVNPEIVFGLVSAIQMHFRFGEMIDPDVIKLLRNKFLNELQMKMISNDIELILEKA